MTLNDLKTLADDVVGRLRGQRVDALHVGALAFRGWQPAVGYSFDDLHLLVKEDDLGRADSAMRGGGYVRVAWADGVPQPADDLASPSPVTPDTAYSDQADVAGGRWIQIYTTRRHGPLLLVDVEDWFNHSVPIRMPGLRGHFRPTDWALLLWQASLVTNAASEGSPTVEREVAKLRAIINRLGGNWRDVCRNARDYDGEYLTRLDRFRAGIDTYAQQQHVAVDRFIAPVGGSVLAADLDYGVRYDLYHALNAFDPHTAAGAIQGAIDEPRQGTEQRPRKVWDSQRLWTTHDTIYDQVTKGLWAPLLYQHLGGADIANAPQHGYWNTCRPADFRRIFGPIP